MKKIISILIVLVSLTTYSQTEVHNQKVKLKTTPQGSKSDSLIVKGADNILKYLRRTDFLEGVSDGNDFLTSVSESGGLLTFNIPNQTNPTFNLDSYLATKSYLTEHQDLSGYLTFAQANSSYEPIKGSDDNFVTDAEKIVIGNTSGVNTGDQDLTNYVDKTTNQTLGGVKTFNSEIQAFGGVNLPMNEVVEFSDFSSIGARTSYGVLPPGSLIYSSGYSGHHFVDGNGDYDDLHAKLFKGLGATFTGNSTLSQATINTLNVTGTTSGISHNDLDDKPTLSLIGNDLSISGGNTVTLPSSGGSSYSVITGLVSQLGSTLPTVIIHENTTGATLSNTTLVGSGSAGFRLIFSQPIFIEDYTWFSLTNNFENNPARVLRMNRENTTTFYFRGFNNGTSNAGLFDKVPFEIRVYYQQ